MDCQLSFRLCFGTVIPIEMEKSHKLKMPLKAFIILSRILSDHLTIN